MSSEQGVRSVRLTTYLSATEKKRARIVAAENGMTLTAWVRFLIQTSIKEEVK